MVLSNLVTKSIQNAETVADKFKGNFLDPESPESTAGNRTAGGAYACSRWRPGPTWSFARANTRDGAAMRCCTTRSTRRLSKG